MSEFFESSCFKREEVSLKIESFIDCEAFDARLVALEDLGGEAPRCTRSLLLGTHREERAPLDLVHDLKSHLPFGGLWLLFRSEPVSES